jgi:hypothetical protein
MGRTCSIHQVLLGNVKGKEPLGDPEVDGSLILKYLLKEWALMIGYVGRLL